MQPVRVDVATLWRHSSAIFSDEASLRRLKHRLEFAFGASRLNREAVEHQLKGPFGAALNVALTRDPRLYGLFTWPFLNKDLNVPQRFSFVAQHMHIVHTRFPWMDLTAKQQRVVLDLADKFPELKLVIESAPWFVREGCLNFSLLLGRRRLMTLSFTLAQTGAELNCYVGSLQGNSEPDANEIYKAIAEKLQDVRPRDFLFKAFRIFMLSLGVKEIHCIADDHHIRNHQFFGRRGRSAIQLPYDAMWLEHGAHAKIEGFLSMAAGISERPLAEVPQKKRGRYKRRLEMFQGFQTEFDSFVKRFQAIQILELPEKTA